MGATAAKGSGKAAGKDGKKGKGKGKGKEPKEQKAPDKTAREPVTTSPVEGLVEKSRGKVCWIRPDEPIEHDEAEKHGGKIFLHANDMEEGESEFPLAGARVRVFGYSDGQGLGAE